MSVASSSSVWVGRRSASSTFLLRGSLFVHRPYSSSHHLTPAFELTHLLKDIRHSIRRPRSSFFRPSQSLLTSLDEAIQDLSGSRPLRVAIWGDRISRTSELVDCLLSDPLHSDPNPARALAARKPTETGLIRIRSVCASSYRPSIIFDSLYPHRA